MLDILRRFSARLTFTRPLFIALGLLALITLVFEVFGQVLADDDALLIPSIILLLWSLMGFTFANTFREAPDSNSLPDKFFARVKFRLRQILYVGIAFLFFTLTIASLYMSYKLLGIS